MNKAWETMKRKLKRAKVRKEGSIQLSVTKYARKLGWRVTKRSHMSAYGSNGEPDYEFAAMKRVSANVTLPYSFMIEFKTPGEGPSPLQEEKIAELRRLGFSVYVCDNAERGRELVDIQTKYAIVNKKWKARKKKP